MTQNSNVVWPEDMHEVVEETRLLGNNFYRCKQYRAAALLYRTGLGVLAPGDVVSTTYGHGINVDAPEEIYKLFFTLLLNLAQALLNIPPRDMHSELAAMDASTICALAGFQMEYAVVKRHRITFEDFVRQLQHTACPPELAHLGGLMAKARSRRSIALERCGNISGAFNDFPCALGSLPAGIKEQDWLERLVLGFDSPASGLMLPKEAMHVFSRPLECCHRAAVDFIEIDHGGVKQCATPLGEMAGAFSCGRYKEAAVIVMSYLRADNNGGPGYIIGNWRGTGERIRMYTWGAFTPQKRTSIQSGAVLGSVLYCLSMSLDCCEMRGFHLLGSFNISGGFQAPLKLMPPTEVTLARRDAALVACCGAMYLFGGCIQENRKGKLHVGSQDLIKFKPKLSNLSVQCSLVQTATGSERPSARWGHATFVHGAHIYIFGGMYERQKGSEKWDMYWDNMWRFDVKSGVWTKVQVFSCMPCARAHMGVAFDERRAMIVGGVTSKSDGKKVYLADVWEFDFESCCWIQVVPEKPSEDPWISARCGAACGLVNGNVLVTLEGTGRYGPVGRDDMTLFTVKRGIGARIATKAGTSGPHRDEALIRACADMAAMKSHVAALPDWLRSLFTAPAGSVNLLAVPSLDLLEGTVTPLRKSMAAFERVLPIDCIFSPESITPLRPLGGDPGNVWGSTECPFDVAPRWLSAPLEVSVNLATSSSATQPLKGPVNLRQTNKQFGTVKAAVEYFKLCQPKVHPSGWQRIKVRVLHEDAERAATRGWQVQECEAFALEDPLSCMQQIYIMAVLGPIFFSFLATRCSQQNSEPASFIGTILFKLQVYMLCVPGSMVSTCCHHCGKRDKESCRNITTKVCRGCHLVRYCSSKCQHADWKAPFGHKEVCKKYASQLPERRR